MTFYHGPALLAVLSIAEGIRDIHVKNIKTTEAFILLHHEAWPTDSQYLLFISLRPVRKPAAAHAALNDRKVRATSPYSARAGMKAVADSVTNTPNLQQR